MRILKIRGIEEAKLFYILIVLFCMNFLGRGSVFCLLFSLLSLFRMPRKIALDVDMLFTLILCFSSFFASLFFENLNEAIKCLNFFLMYMVGLNGYYTAPHKGEYIKKTLFAMYTGFFTNLVLIFLSSIIRGEYTNTQYLLTTNYWTGENIATTIVGLISSVIIGYSFYALVCQKAKWLKIMSIISLGIALYLGIQTANRTTILLLFVVWFFMVCIYLPDHWKKNVIKIFIMVIMLLLLFLFWNQLINKSSILTLPGFERLLKVGLATRRIEIMKIHFFYMFDFLWGGSNIVLITGELAHNYIQQGHDLYGIFATIALCMLELSFIKNIARLIRKRIKGNLDYLLISLYVSMIILAHLEPIFSSYPVFFFSLLLIHGLTNGYLRSERKKYLRN